MKEPPALSPENASFSVDSDRMLHLHSDTHEDLTVAIRRMFPVTHPHKFLSVHDEENEIGIIEDLSRFPADQQKLIEAEIQHQYFVPRIREIRQIKDEYGYYLWDTVTDRGPRTFYVKGRTDNIHRKGGGRTTGIHVHDNSRMFVTDIENCKYEIADQDQLSRSSRRELYKML